MKKVKRCKRCNKLLPSTNKTNFCRHCYHYDFNKKRAKEQIKNHKCLNCGTDVEVVYPTRCASCREKIRKKNLEKKEKNLKTKEIINKNA